MLRIVNWSQHYENSISKKLKHVNWIPLPNRMDGVGYRTLIAGDNGAEMLGAWVAILEIFSRQDPRGVFPFDASEAARRLAIISGLKREVFEQALPLLESIGWLSLTTTVGDSTSEVVEATTTMGARGPSGSILFPSVLSIPCSSVPCNSEKKSREKSELQDAGFESAEDFSAWWDALVERHPNRNKQAVARSRCMEAILARNFSRDAFNDGYGALAEASRERWQEERGRFCPNLYQIFEDGLWKYTPPKAEKPKEKFVC